MPASKGMFLQSGEGTEPLRKYVTLEIQGG